MENEDLCLSSSPVETVCQSHRQSKISYTRDFLLSFCELDICKSLPSGVDPSIISEFEEASNSIPDRQRIPGGLSFQSSKRVDYGSTQPTRVESSSSSYSRGSHGRWDNHSSGSNDGDGELQPDRGLVTQDFGRRHGNQSRRSWKIQEHDGLLGSGAFPKPSPHTGGASTPKVQGSDLYQLNRSSEPNHPPRPYKAVPHSRRETNDLCNDETFGSAECSSQDREEAERKRRNSFELMRKEQQKALQEKQKEIPNKRKEKFETDIPTLLENTEDEKRFWNKNIRSEDCVAPSVSQNDSTKCSLRSQAPASRPLVPPGFASTILEKNVSTNSVNPSPSSQAGNIGFEDNNTHHKDTTMATDAVENQEKDKQSEACVYSNEQNYENENVAVTFMDGNENIVIPASDVVVPIDFISDFENPSSKTSTLQEVSEIWKDSADTNFDVKKVKRHEIANTVDQDHSVSILEKLFGNAVTLNGGGLPGIVEHHDVTTEHDTWGSVPSQSSKFAHQFLEVEEKKPIDDVSSFKARDLLSLIVSSEKGGSQVSTVSAEKDIEHTAPVFPFNNNEFSTEKFITSTATSSMVEILKPFHQGDERDASSGLMTCEDLEQTMLAKANESSSSMQPSVQVMWGDMDATAELQKTDVDDHASRHLLSLLQKGTSLKEPTSSTNLDISSSDKLGISEIRVSSTSDSASGGNAEKIPHCDKTLTLETVFGMAFMKELHSAEAPLSVNRVSISSGSTRTNALELHGLPISVADDGFFRSTGKEYGSNKACHELNSLESTSSQEANPNKVLGHWLGLQDPQTGVVDLRLPEEGSLITLGEPVNHKTLPTENATKTEDFLTKSPIEIVDKLAAMNAVLRDERSMVPGLDGSPPLLRGHYNTLESELPYQHLRGQRLSSPQFFYHQMNHTRPPFQSLDHSLRNPQIKFLGPGSMHHDPPHHPFPVNMLHLPLHNSPGDPRFDPAHLSLLQDMPMPRNFLPPHLPQGLQRGAPLPHPVNHMTGYLPQLNPMQGVHLNHRQPNHDGFGLAMAGSGGGGYHPEALERLIEMELRANSKQMPPIAGGHNSHGMNYGK